ncbi:LysM domain-containing GPI-anchored protein 2 [Raphanus sativus]|uniref:LysM domain-containing GPI-anchored protein 2 n=1 Tax=Raphanus sativus TaxID=3726 RepID=A0A6J0P6X4_RAPSA|nr:lysM domain-containing GPI-anchored protein 2 [Raphanus sativus]KAJ4897059.1 LysM domain-containing GPI-anchored protein 2 [Raphanus sativus]
MKTYRFTLPLLLIAISFLHSLSAQMTGNFKCGQPGASNTTCRSLVGYSSKNATTYASIRTLFAVENLRSILEANNLPLSTAGTQRVNPNQVVRVPIPCTCSNGTGVSTDVPVHTVKQGDTLSAIASDLFGGLVSFQRISEMNKIPNPNEIVVGQRVWIPLPCSCNEVNGRDVVHYAHVVVPGSSLAAIAAQFGTDNTTLALLNGISGDAQLLAELPLDVPLRACSSSVRNDSLDASSMLLPNGSYSITANNCIRCSCEASNNWTLSCEASQLTPTTWPTCPPSRCQGAESLFIGNTTSTSCGPRSCAYAGYSNQTILTTLSPDPCSGSGGSRPPSGGSRPPSGNYASTFSPSFSFVVVLIQCALYLL